MIRDIAYIVSAGTLIYGLWMAWPPVAVIVAAALVLAILISTDARWTKQ